MACGVRYYFHIRDRDRMIADEEGVELPSLATAIQEATLAARALLADAAADGDDISHQVIEVTDTEGIVVHELSLSGSA